ncbi:MAG TPA: hypothetical protein VKR82_01115 [Candidatus Acidoferrales bacterium]|nr:hypothetical protein [Candidatus Acidoferrales bacterium]
MFLALTVLLLHPPAVPAAAIPRLPLNSMAYSSALLTTDSAKDADDTKSASDKSSDSKNSTAAPAIPSASSVFTALAKPAVSPDLVAFEPGQLELTPMDDAAGSSSSRSYGSGSTAPAGFHSTEKAGHARFLPPKKWLVLSAAEHGAATFDAWSTRQVIMNGTGQELNPLLRPFANSNALYAAVQVAPFAFDYLGLRMMRSSHPWVRKMWWVPQTASTVSSFVAGAHNMNVH